MFSARVIGASSGRPIKNKKVTVSLGVYELGRQTEGVADQNGDAHLNGRPGERKVCVDENTAFQGKIAGRVIAHV